MSDFIYKLFLASQWQAFAKSGTFAGTPLDVKDGYIHLSTAEQARETARLHFKDKGDLVLAEFNGRDFAETLQGGLKYEPARDGSLFPHLYGQLAFSQLKRSWLLQQGPDGQYVFPAEFIVKNGWGL